MRTCKVAERTNIHKRLKRERKITLREKERKRLQKVKEYIQGCRAKERKHARLSAKEREHARLQSEKERTCKVVKTTVR